LNALGRSVRTDGVFDQTVEDQLRAFQASAYLPETGVLDGNTRDALNVALAKASQPLLMVKAPPGGAGFRGKVELHFYPGDHALKLYVIKDGKVLDTYGMVGGHKVGFKDEVHNNGIDYWPSPRGTFDALTPKTIVSSAWPLSRVPYGAQLRELEGEVQYRSADGAWHFATGPRSVLAKGPSALRREDFLLSGSLQDTWQNNDFGHLSAYLRSRRTGEILGSIIHSSADNETTEAYFRETVSLREPAAALERLRHSHGCEHIHPRDMDELVTKGYFGAGTTLRIHGYDEVPAL
jgi:hypothetical protein